MLSVIVIAAVIEIVISNLETHIWLQWMDYKLGQIICTILLIDRVKPS